MRYSIFHMHWRLVKHMQLCKWRATLRGWNEFGLELCPFFLSCRMKSNEKQQTKKCHTASRINEAPWLTAEKRGFWSLGSAKSLRAQWGVTSNCDAASVKVQMGGWPLSWEPVLLLQYRETSEWEMHNSLATVGHLPSWASDPKLTQR